MTASLEILVADTLASMGEIGTDANTITDEVVADGDAGLTEIVADANVWDESEAEA